MHRGIDKILAVSGLLLTIYFAAPAPLRAQSAPGPLQSPKNLPPPLPPAAPKAQKKVEVRESIAGNWQLNKDESDDGRNRIEQAARSGKNNNNGPYGGNGPYGRQGCGGGGYPPTYPGACGPGGGYPNGGPGNGPGGRQPNGDALKGLEEYAFASDTLTIANKEPEFDLTDDHFRKRVFYTDGRKIENSKDEQKQEIAAHWDGMRLVSDEKGPQNRKISRTFELSSDGHELYENIHIDKERSGSAVDIRYVYDAVAHLE
jgi:hypothetical protein